MGHMELDAVVAHGASRFLLERTVLSSDGRQVFICKQCRGAFAGDQGCARCGLGEYEARHISHSTLLLQQELRGAGINWVF